MAKKSQPRDDVMSFMTAATQRRVTQSSCDGHGHEAESTDVPGCTIRALPDRLQAKAAAVAAAVNPVNMPQSFMALSATLPDDPLALTLVVGKYLGSAPRTLTVSFLEATPVALRDRILQHMNAWSRCCGISFRFTAGIGQVRISRAGAGYWSYLGTDILLIPQNRPTMNLQGFTMATPESEYRRVVRHETGHTLGFPHEHMRRELVNRIDPQKAYAYFAATQGWSRAQVDAQVLTPLSQASIIGTPADQTSIMCYQLPGSITRDGRPIVGGLDINATDCAFSGKVYPKAASAPGMGRLGIGDFLDAGDGLEDASDWSAEEDVDADTAIEELIGEREPAD
ncbi:MAG: hypothetical protein QOG72_2491 [Sphingomonadales bacterium]|jgi:hypothetical protein|nr:hypothetical protein [Sphingomonadales bacterium]